MPSVDGVNYPGPWEIRLNYSAPAATYPLIGQVRVNVDVDTPPDPGSPFSDYDLKSRAGLFYNAEGFTDAWVTLLADLYKNDASFVNAEMWKYESGTFNASFQSAHVIGFSGTSSSNPQAANQVIFTFRSQNGGHVRCTLGHTIFGANTTDTYPFSNAVLNDLATFYIANSSPIIARDGGYLFSIMNFLAGQNERYFKRYFRP